MTDTRRDPCRREREAAIHYEDRLRGRNPDERIFEGLEQKKKLEEEKR